MTDLTQREVDVLEAVASGLTNAQIGTLLGTSPLTVKTQIATAAEKLGASGRAGTVGAAFRAGWLR